MTEFFDLLTAAEAEALRQVGHRQQWSRGAMIYRQGERSERVVVLRTGRVKVSTDTPSGVEVVLAVRGPGALVGELSSLDGEPLSASVSALEPVTALVVPHPAFESYLHANGRVAFLLMRQIVGRLRDADRKRVEFGAFDTTGRVAARLVELAERFGQPTDGGLRIGVALSQDDLAGWTGASREAVTKALRQLRSAGWISTGRMNVVVRDLDALRERAQ
jgi:CRP-like cAMP-binding protein